MSKRVSNWTLREVAVTIFRRKWLLLGPLAIIFFGAVILALVLPDRYQSRMKILVKNSRADGAGPMCMVSFCEPSSTNPR